MVLVPINPSLCLSYGVHVWYMNDAFFVDVIIVNPAFKTGLLKVSLTVMRQRSCAKLTCYLMCTVKSVVGTNLDI